MLNVENLKVCYGGIEALKDVSFKVEKGKLVTLVGGSRIVAMSFCEPRSWTRVLSS